MSYIPARIAAFFVCNISYGQKEGTEHEKILFYHPSDVTPDEKTSYIGFSEALIRFSSTFSKEKPIKSVQQENHRLALYNPEPDIWMVLLVANPQTIKNEKGGGTTTTILDHELKDDVLFSILEQAYDMFRLFNGSFQYLLENFSLRTLRDKLEVFFPQYVTTIDVAGGNVLDVLAGIQFLPVDKDTYLLIQCFVNLTENGFTNIRHTAFLYDDHLVWSGLEQEEMRILYRYLTSHLARNEIGTAGSSASSRLTGGVFVTGPANLEDPEAPINVPQVFLGPNHEESRLVIYQQLRVSVLLLVDPKAASDISFYSELQSSLTPAISNLAAVIETKYSKVLSFEDQYRFLYFNHMNLALKTSIRVKRPPPTHPNPLSKYPPAPHNPNSVTISRELAAILSDIHSDFEDCGETDQVKEVVLKTQNDGWVVGRKSDRREFFVLFDQKNANLVDIHDEIQKLSDTYFHNIFIN